MTVWVAGVTPLSADNMNSIEDRLASSKIIWAQPHTATGTGAVLASSYPEYGCALLANNQDGTIYFSLPIPTGFTSITKAVIRLIAQGTGNLYIAAYTNFAAVGEAYNANTDSVALAAVAVTSAQISEYDISGALTGIAAGDTVGIRFFRNGSNALDTSEDAAYILGVLIEYV